MTRRDTIHQRTKLNTIPRNIDLHRLAGLNRVVGVDLTERMVRVVELEKKGNILNRFSASFTVVSSCAYEVDPTDRPQDRIRKIRDFIRQNTTVTRAVTSLRGAGTKTIIASIPRSAESVGEWIDDRYEELIRLPVPRTHTTCSYEVLEERDNTLEIEITFVRKEEVEKTCRFFEEIGLELVGLSAGIRDALNPLLVEGKTDAGRPIHLLHLENGSFSLLTYQNGVRGQVKPFAGPPLPREDDSSNLLCGEVTGFDRADGWSVVRPLGLAAEFTLAVGLALKGFFPEMNRVDFLGPAGEIRRDETLWKSLTRRSVIALGVTLFLVLAVPFAVSAYYQSRLEGFDEAMTSAGPVYHEIAALEEQVKALEVGMTGTNPAFDRTQFARVLHDVAASTMDSLWLYRIVIDGSGKGSEVLVLAGFTRAPQSVTVFMKKLQSSGLCHEVSLLRSGAPLQSESLVPAAERNSMISFEIEAALKGRP